MTLCFNAVRSVFVEISENIHTDTQISTLINQRLEYVRVFVPDETGEQVDGF